MRSPQFYAGVVRGILFFSILCHLVGFSAPGWLCLKETDSVGYFAYRETGNLESYGVWFALRCGSDRGESSSCVPENYYTTDSIYGNRLNFSPGKSWILHWQLKTTGALVACIFATVFVHMQRNLLLQYRPGQEPPKKIKYVIAFICCSVAGSLLSWPVGQFIQINRAYQGRWSFGKFTTSIPYALIAAGVGAVLNWICVLILLIILCKRMCIEQSSQMVMVPPATQTQMIPLMPVQNPPGPMGYADPMNPMYQSQQNYQSQPMGHYPGEHTQRPPGPQYNYQPPMYPQMDTKTQPEGQFYPPSQQYPPYQYNQQPVDDSAYMQKSVPT